MDFGTSLGLLTAIVALGIAAWAAWTAQQTLKRNAAPQLECFLRPRPSNTVFDFVIINTGSGSAYNGPAGLFKQDVAFRDRTGPRKRNLLRASRLGRIDKVRPIRQNMPIW